MPEGPSILIVQEKLSPLVGEVVREASGSEPLPFQKIAGKRIREIRTWGKHLLIVFDEVTIRIHFHMFGSWALNSHKNRPPKISFAFENGHELNFYTCGVRWINGSIENVYDWSADVMGSSWNSSHTKKKLRKLPDMQVCDALMDQDLFSGVGNIIKNEVLFRIRVDPRSSLGALPAKQLNALVKEARAFSFEFLAWKKESVLKKHLLAYGKKSARATRLHSTLKLRARAKELPISARTVRFFIPCEGHCDGQA